MADTLHRRDQRDRTAVAALVVLAVSTVLAVTAAVAGALPVDATGGPTEVPASASASGYVPSTTDGARSLDVSGFAPVCIKDAPFIEYSIVPVGFSSSGPATLTFTDNAGTLVDRTTVPALTGQLIYPGATIDASGNATDWPGWTRADDGSWIPDQSDAALRDGLQVLVEVEGVTASTTVSYVGSTAPCANPPDTPPPCTPGGPTDATCDIPSTGTDSTRWVAAIAVALLLGGIMATLVARRRSAAAPPA